MICNTDYERQIYTMLSTDDLGDFSPNEGDVVYLMDQSKCYIFDGSAMQQLPDLSGGGGGGSGYQLLGSGDYVYTGGEAASLNFPVSFDGTIKYWYCVADTVAGINHAHAFMGIEDMPGVTNFHYGHVGVISTMTSAGVVANNVIDDNTKYSSGRLYLYRANNTYKIQNSTYHWFIYGEV